MGSLKKVPPEGGSGGKRGHSGMEHWAETAEYKDAARLKRRQADRAQVDEQLDASDSDPEGFAGPFADPS